MLIFERQIELYRNLVDVSAPTLVLLPDMLQVAAGDEHQVKVAYHLPGVANDATGTGTACHEVQLHHVVTVDRIVELPLVAVGDIQKIMLP
jgi:hypothetical protein